MSRKFPIDQYPGLVNLFPRKIINKHFAVKNGKIEKWNGIPVEFHGIPLESWNFGGMLFPWKNYHKSVTDLKTDELPTFDENHNKLNAHGFKILNPP